MKAKLLKRLRRKHCIVAATIHVIKQIYSVKPLHKFPGTFNEPDMVKWCSYSYKEAVIKQRELILEDVSKLRNVYNINWTNRVLIILSIVFFGQLIIRCINGQ